MPLYPSGESTTMENLEDELNRPEVREQYFNGLKNQLIRIYYYLKQGLNLFNDFKYLGAGIFAVFYLLKLDSLGAMIIMFIISVPVLIVIGYTWTHKAERTIEYFNLKFTTHFGQYTLRVQEKQLATLLELNENLKKLNAKKDA